MIAAPEDGWIRLDPRKLLLDPVKAIGQAVVPVLVALVGISRSDTSYWPFLLPVVVIGPLLLGALPWLTTTYRLTESQFQLRSGVINKRTSTAPLDRVRSVDLEASLLHRVLGLEKVQVGTGVDDERITLDALARLDAARLRATLLARTRPDVPAGTPTTSGPAGPGRPEGWLQDPSAPVVRRPVPPQELAAIDWSWLRFAPFSLARLVVVAGALGVLSQFADDLPILDADQARSAWEWLRQFAVALVVVVLAVGALVGWVLIAVLGYVVQWWGFRLTREAGSLHLRSGLVTTRSVTVEEAKVRGVELGEPLLLRGVGGAELRTLTTGLENGTTQVLPPCPREVAVGVGGDVLGEVRPLRVPLVPHGPRARRRAWFAAVRGVLVLPALAVVPVWRWDLAWWWPLVVAAVTVPLAAVVGEAAYRHLGHALAGDHLVAGSGSLARVRTVLETEGVIGWVLTQSWWQRRIGLAHLVVTTAAGAERVVVRDVPVAVGVALADATTPGLLTPFLVPTDQALGLGPGQGERPSCSGQERRSR
ncbi:MAG: transmembrane protein, distant homology with ydbT [uncultured Nocardioides sp.]|uniref:Transmembrane protein, distant homology with ydbT n=1 Tax=uncultured Nocardioides sp. TaxID=198441 RepID=A0A6J4P771_9ACTN|nr:MAG: transmembrane protein, distant homology with ydbT [uncultured Nocardioides sp.]